VHGLALNVTLPGSSFAPIVPCGKVGAQVTSLQELLGAAVVEATVEKPVDRAVDKSAAPTSLALPQLARRLVAHLAETLELRFCERAADDLVEFRDCKTEIVTDSMGEA